MKPNIPQYDRYEANLQTDLQLLCCQRGWLKGKFIHTDDLEEKWKEIAPEFLQDAVDQFERYPIATLAWPVYIGMAEAALWDEDWESNRKHGYGFIRGEEGFDTLDDNIIRNILHLAIDSDTAHAMDAQAECLANTANSNLRHEGVEPGTSDAFYLFTRTLRVMYRMGVALELTRRGYKWEEVE